MTVTQSTCNRSCTENGSYSRPGGTRLRKIDPLTSRARFAVCLRCFVFALCFCLWLLCPGRRSLTLRGGNCENKRATVIASSERSVSKSMETRACTATFGGSVWSSCARCGLLLVRDHCEGSIGARDEAICAVPPTPHSTLVCIPCYGINRSIVLAVLILGTPFYRHALPTADPEA